ncbi:MAG TPA: SGNH/GDSL hydrolase family protein [Thermoanaerobaculia bacterium]|nr:SGNH/GDSL hydrolase family protein [Thermoanaerobaculia bacterium]
MKRMHFRATVGVAALLTLFALPLSAQTTFHKYVALGDSLTAGLEGGCLVTRHQQRSFPKLVADALGISDFQQPLFSERAVTSPTGVCLGAVVANGAITVGAVSQQGVPTNSTLARPYDNLGVPGANAADLVDLRTANASGNTANRFAAAILRNFAGGPFEGRNAVEEANLLNPDLVTVWIGSNDVLNAALAGAAIDGVTLTPAAVFEAKFTQIMTGLRATGRTVVVLNVPEVTAIPFATTVPRVVVNPTTRQPVLVGGNPVPLLGPRTTSTCSTAPCPLPAGTLVTLGASSLLAQGIGIPTSLGGTGQPLPDGSFSPPSTLNQGVLLYPEEVDLIRQRTTEINDRIASVAAANGATVVDTHALFDEIVAHGYEAGGGIVITSAFLTGGLFSADGFHPSNIGFAIAAKEIIQHLNDTKGAELELPNLAHTLFEADVPVITATGVADPAAGPFGFSTRMWKDLVFTAAPGDFTYVFPGPGKRMKSLER